MSRITVLVGNPKPGSRTRRLAEEVARQVGARTGAGDDDVTVIELAEHTGELFDWSSTVVAGLVGQLVDSDLLVVASPTFKGTYTGLLKVFLDRIGAGQLAGTPTIPVMTGGKPDHALAVEHTLRPLLVEIGASTPTRGLYVTESEIEDPAVPVKAFLDVWGATLERAVVPA
jgi:FMN reductase